MESVSEYKNMSCGTCRYALSMDQFMAECHRNAPCHRQQNISIPCWPIVRLDDWCGEYHAGEYGKCHKEDE
jgi:hypothetical protein